MKANVNDAACSISGADGILKIELELQPGSDEEGLLIDEFLNSGVPVVSTIQTASGHKHIVLQLEGDAQEITDNWKSRLSALREAQAKDHPVT